MQPPSILKPLLILSTTAILLSVMHIAASFLLPVLFSLFFAALLTPIYRWLVQKRLSKGVALILSIVFLILVALLLLLLVGSSLSVLEEGLNTYRDQFNQRREELAGQLERVNLPFDTTPLVSIVEPDDLVNVLRYALGTIASIMKSALIIFFLTIFFLVEVPLLLKRMNGSFGVDHPLPKNLVALARLMVNYFGARVLVNLVNAAATGVMLWLFGIDYAGLWTVLLFFMSFIPYIGAVISMIPPLFLAYAESGLGLSILVGVLAILINGISENIFQPMIMGKTLSISPTVVFLSTIFWMFILGGPGALIAMPLTVAVLLFMRNFSETRGFVGVAITTPEPAEEPVSSTALAL
jgi:AI-2 transport protein TqsA